MFPSLALILGACLLGQAPAHASTDGLKIVFREYDVSNRELLRGEMILLGGRWYQFRNTDQEIQIFNLKSKKVELIDLRKKSQSEITFSRLDESLKKLKRAIEGSIEKKRIEGGRANEVAAKMTLDLIEPRFAPRFDEKTMTASLSNESVQIEATGANDLDAARLAEWHQALTYQIKLESERNPTKIPPFARLDSIKELVEGHKLRPTEIVDVYRLAGKPLKERRTYELVKSLSDREHKAIARIIEIQGLLKVERFDVYERESP